MYSTLKILFPRKNKALNKRPEAIPRKQKPLTSLFHSEMQPISPEFPLDYNSHHTQPECPAPMENSSLKKAGIISFMSKYALIV